MTELIRPAGSAILDHALADLRTAANGTGQITTIAAGVTTVWPLDDAEHAVLTAVEFCWRDDRSALILETPHGPRVLTPRNVGSIRPASGGGNSTSTRLYETADGMYVDADAYDAGVRAGLERAAEKIERGIARHKMGWPKSNFDEGLAEAARQIRAELAGTEVPE